MKQSATQTCSKTSVWPQAQLFKKHLHKPSIYINTHTHTHPNHPFKNQMRGGSTWNNWHRKLSSIRGDEAMRWSNDSSLWRKVLGDGSRTPKNPKKQQETQGLWWFWLELKGYLDGYMIFFSQRWLSKLFSLGRSARWELWALSEIPEAGLDAWAKSCESDEELSCSPWWRFFLAADPAGLRCQSGSPRFEGVWRASSWPGDVLWEWSPHMRGFWESTTSRVWFFTSLQVL